MGVVGDWDFRMAKLAKAAADLLNRRVTAEVALAVERDSEEAEAPPGGSEAGAALVWIEYENAAGVVSARNVTLRRIWPKDGCLYFSGLCHARRKVRTFRGDRVLSLTCLTTGEVADDPEAWLEGHGLFDEHFTPVNRGVGPTNLAIKNALPGLSLLMFLARADGHLDPDEVEVALDYVMMSTTDHIDRKACADRLARMVPDAEDLDKHFKYFFVDEARWTNLRMAARRLVDADRVVDSAEQLAWSWLEGAYRDGLALQQAKRELEFEERVNSMPGLYLGLANNRMHRSDAV